MPFVFGLKKYGRPSRDEKRRQPTGIDAESPEALEPPASSSSGERGRSAPSRREDSLSAFVRAQPRPSRRPSAACKPERDESFFGDLTGGGGASTGRPPTDMSTPGWGCPEGASSFGGAERTAASSSSRRGGGLNIKSKKLANGWRWGSLAGSAPPGLLASCRSSRLADSSRLPSCGWFQPSFESMSEKRSSTAAEPPSPSAALTAPSAWGGGCLSR